MATLKSIAVALNLSVMAVSKALRDAPDISAATKARVSAEAKRQNYIPNRAAQNLRSRNTQLFGVLVPSIHNTYYSGLASAMERQAEAHGYQVILAQSHDEAEREMRAVRQLISRQVQGVALVPMVRWQNRLATLELLAEANIPVVLLDRFPAGSERFPRTSWIVSSDQLGAELATQHLIDLGHKEILFLGGPNGSSASAARFSGYQRILTNSKIGYDDQRVFLAGGGLEGGEKAMAQALSEAVKFTAIVAFNDSVAMGAINALLRQGLRVPQDVSVVGFNDGQIAANFKVPLTTLKVAQQDMGTLAIEMLFDLAEGKKLEPRTMPVELVTRESTAKM
jgi:LacI family transcriptional regulator